MNPQELLKLLQHIRVWLPKGSFIREEVTQLIGQLRQQLNMPPEMTE
jgi:hypothetical protein